MHSYVCKIKIITTKIVVVSIKLYSHIISPCFFPVCRFYPSCSQYAIQSIQKYGIGVGLFKSIVRICKCNPWNKGGYDPVK